MAKSERHAVRGNKPGLWLALALNLAAGIALGADVPNILDRLRSSGSVSAPAYADSAGTTGLYFGTTEIDFSVAGVNFGKLNNNTIVFGSATITNPAGSIVASGPGNTVTGSTAYILGSGNSITVSGTPAGADLVINGVGSSITNGWDFNIYGSFNTMTGIASPGSNPVGGGIFGSNNILNTSTGTVGADIVLSGMHFNFSPWAVSGVLQWIGGQSLNSTMLSAYPTKNVTILGHGGGTNPVYSVWDADAQTIVMNAPSGVILKSTAPTMGACGTSPSVTGSSNAMLVTIGTGGAATSCAVNFGAAFPVAPVCIAQNNTDKVAYSIATTTAAVTVSAAAAFTASSKLHIHCMGI